MLFSARWKSICITGFAMFSMFFGSGNIFVPLLIGQESGDFFLSGAAGLFISAILVVFLGLLGVVMSKGDKREYFKELPYPVYFVMITLFLSLVGPFGVIPRCTHVAFSGIAKLLPAFPMPIFTLIFCVLIIFIILDENNVVGIIGKYLTPFKLGSILLITVLGLYYSPRLIDAPSTLQTSFDALKFGLTTGYHTMDLVVSFFFSSVIYRYIKTHIECETNSSEVCQKEIFYRSLIACILGIILISTVYISFIVLGAQYREVTVGLSHEMIFPTITEVAFGSFAVSVLAFTLFTSCLATAIILVELYVEFLYEEVFRGFLSRNVCIAITMMISFFMTLVGFSKLYCFLSSILNVVYPLLVVFAIYKLVYLIRLRNA